jgi:hypothetical protein
MIHQPIAIRPPEAGEPRRLTKPMGYSVFPLQALAPSTIANRYKAADTLSTKLLACMQRYRRCDRPASLFVATNDN